MKTAGVAQAFAQTLERKYGIVLKLSAPAWGTAYEPDIVQIEVIIVPKELRGTGVGTQAMQEVVRWADTHGFILALDPSSDFGSSMSRLRQFYGRFGFVPNRGRKKDFRTMRALLRYPLAQMTKSAAQVQHSLFGRVLRLAYARPQLRKYLLPVLLDEMQ